MVAVPNDRPTFRGHLRNRELTVFHAVQLSTVLLNVWWTVYLILTPPERFTGNPVWASALSIVPGQDPALLGMTLGLVALACALATARTLHALAWFGHGLGAATWLMVGGSWSYAAWVNGLGWGNVGFALFITMAHVALLFAQRPGRTRAAHVGH